MKPMLAATIKDIKDIKYPVYASPKLDGIRGVVIDGVLKSRSLKPIPNPFVMGRFSKKAYSGLDGELILGSPTAKDVYRQTNGACARHVGSPDVKFYVFDNYLAKGELEDRLDHIDLASDVVVVHDQLLIADEQALLLYETECLDDGYEGLILRSPKSLYKFGRSTMKEQGMMKLKRFTDSEAEILEVIEEMENTNEKTTNELGRGTRSSHKAGLRPKGTAGGLRVRDVGTGVEFVVGSGFTDADSDSFWNNRQRSIGKLIKYKSFQVGVKDKPRHPVYLGLREAFDV